MSTTSEPIRYLQPVTTGGWYETTDGRWTEFLWNAGRLTVPVGCEALTLAEREALEVRRLSRLDE